MKQPIVGYHQDEEGHWVAALRCGHGQHVRHDPPWQVREWVTTPEGRASRLGVELNCVRCDEAAVQADIAQLVAAVERGDAEQVTLMLDQRPDLVSARDDSGATALHHAAFHGHRSIVNLLISRGADVNARDLEHDATPSGWAIHYLRELGGLLAIEIEDTLYAIRNRDAGWVERLVTRHPALINATDVNGKPLAEHASESGVESIARLFPGAKARGT
jgi:hypothetical protein